MVQKRNEEEPDPKPDDPVIGELPTLEYTGPEGFGGIEIDNYPFEEYIICKYPNGDECVGGYTLELNQSYVEQLGEFKVENNGEDYEESWVEKDFVQVDEYYLIMVSFDKNGNAILDEDENQVYDEKTIPNEFYYTKTVDYEYVEYTSEGEYFCDDVCILKIMDDNSEAWWDADDAEKKRLHAENIFWSSKLLEDVIYDDETGIYYKDGEPIYSPQVNDY